MGMAKIKKGDTVVILSGKDKGKTGEVTQSLPKDGKVVVAGVNIITRHRKPTQTNPQGGLERKEAPMHASKVGDAAFQHLRRSTPPCRGRPGRMATPRRRAVSRPTKGSKVRPTSALIWCSSLRPRPWPCRAC